jgi:WD40 repeat protein
MVFDPARGELIAGVAGGIQSFDLDTGEVRKDWSRYAIKTQGYGSAYDLAIVSGGQLLAVLFNYGHVRLMDLDTREVRASLDHPGKRRDVSLAVAPSGETLVTCGRSDETVRIWGVKPQPAEILQGESPSINPLSISPDGALIATGSWDGQARIWEVGSGRLIAALPHKGYGDSLAFAPDGRTLTVGSSRGGLSLWDTRSGASLTQLPDVRTVAIGYSPDGSRLAVGQTARIRILDAATLAGRLEIEIGVGKLSTLAWSGDGRLLASGTKGVDLFLWDAESGAQVAHVQGPRGVDYERWGGLLSTAFSPDGTLLAAGWGGAQVSLYRVSDLTLVRSLTGHAQEVFAVAWSPDGRLLASGGRDNHLRLWNPDTGGLLLDVDAHEDYIFSLAFTPDGRRLVTGSGDGTVRLWDSAPASVRWKERALAGRARERLAPMVTALFAETPEAARVAERIESLPGLAAEDRRMVWNLVLERARPVEPPGRPQR